MASEHEPAFQVCTIFLPSIKNANSDKMIIGAILAMQDNDQDEQAFHQKQ